MGIERLLKQKPGIDKTKAPLAEEDLPSFATSDSKKLRPVWITSIVNHLLMVFVVSVIAFSTPESEFKTGWAKQFVNKVGKVIPNIAGHELLREKGLWNARTPFIHGCVYIWLFITCLCIALIIKKPFIKYKGESFKKFLRIRVIFFFVIIFALLFYLLHHPTVYSRWGDDGFMAPFFFKGGVYHACVLYFFFYLINIKELWLSVMHLLGGSDEQ